MYDFLIVGAGLYGAIFAHEAHQRGKRVLIIDKRANIAGNIYTENVEGIEVHKYGAHIFHTNNEKVWKYISNFAHFNHFINSPIANYNGQIYSLPFNMNTFKEMWGVTTVEDAKKIIENQRKEVSHVPQNLEEQAISLVGRDIYEKLIKGYTEKQWGRECNELPCFIIQRLPIRWTFDNNYFDAKYQGIPIDGYTGMVANLLTGIEVRLNENYLLHKAEFDSLAKRVVYTGSIDEFFHYQLGCLAYRSLNFETKILNIANFQNNAVINFTDRKTQWTRIIEHKWFNFGKSKDGQSLSKTIITKEYSSEWKLGQEPYYPINDKKNNFLYSLYRKKAEVETNVIFGGRLGEYKYYDMDSVIESVLKTSNRLLAD